MPTCDRTNTFLVRADRGLGFERYDSDGTRLCAWQVPGDASGHYGRRLGLEYARDVARYFRRHPERASEPLLAAIVAGPAFHTRNRRAVREGFTGGLTTAVAIGWPRPTLESAHCPLPAWELQSGEFYWRLNGCAGEARAPAWQTARGRYFGRAWVAHVRSDPLAPAAN